FTEDDYSYVEGDPNARVCLEGIGQIAQPATATVSSLAQGTATVGEDYVALNSDQVEFTPNGESTVCISVSVTDDPFLEEVESFPLTIDSVSPTPGVVTGSQSSTTFFIRDNDAVSVGFNPTEYMVVEGGSVQLTIERIGDAQEPVAVLVTTTDGTATAGEGDYTPLMQVQVTFNQGESTKTVTLITLDDVPAEGPEYLEATLDVVDPRVTVSTANATVVITDDVVPTISFSTSNYVVGEGDGTVEVCLQLNVPLVADIDFTVTAASGTATADEDFVDEEQRAVFPIGETRACIDFKITDDRLQENDEIFTVAFSSRPGITTGDPATATVTIIDNDDPEPEFDQTMYTVPENNRTLPLCIDIGVLVSEAMEFTITASNKNPPEAQEADFNPSTTITVPAGGSMACIDFTGLVVDDNIALEGDQSFTISVGGSTSMVVIVDDDIPLIESGDVIINEDGGIAVVNVRLLNEIENNFTLDYSTGEVPDGANEGEDFGRRGGRVVFTPRGVKQRSIEIPITDDQQTETDEPLFVTFSSEDIPADRQDMIPSPMVIIIDNDITVGFDPSEYSVAERPGGFVTLTVTRSGNIDLTANVTLLTLQGSADDMDFTIVSTTVEFGPGEDSVPVNISITDDAVPEGVEVFTATLMSNAPNVVVSGSEATITILENDQPVIGTIVNDTIIGDPLFTVTLPNEDEFMCYEVHGYSGKYFNLVSDSCTSVNALFSQLPDNDRINLMSDIGIYTRDDDGQCIQIQISVTGCSGSVDGQALTSSYQVAGVNVRSYPNRWRVSAPNCGSTQLVMWIFCKSEPDMLRFHIARGNNLDPTSHGLLAQFWNIPINITTRNGEPYVQVFDPTHENYRLIPAFPAPRTWDHTPAPCYYVGNAQGGPSRSHDPRESVIEGKVDDYETSSLFSPIFLYAQFDESVCSTAA
ncbi:Extracellular matrix protein FRAS1, partial [Geodia barretti]